MEGEQAQQSAPAQQPVPDSQQEQLKTQGSSKTLTIVLIITVLSLCLSGYLAYQNYQLRQEISLEDGGGDSVVTPEPYPIEVRPTPEGADSDCKANFTYEGRCVIFGDISAYRGETDYYKFKLEVYSKSGSDIEMQYGSDKGALSDGWIPFTEFIDIPHNDFDTYVFVEYRDSEGNQTPAYVSTTSPLYPIGQVAE